MAKKHVNIIVWVLSLIILVPLAFITGKWVFILIMELPKNNFFVFGIVLGIVALFIVLIVFINIRIKYLKAMFIIILTTFILSGIYIAFIWICMQLVEPAFH